MFLNFFHLVMQQQSLWGNIGIYSDGFGPKPGEGPKPEQAWTPTFGEGQENWRFFNCNT